MGATDLLPAKLAHTSANQAAISERGLLATSCEVSRMDSLGELSNMAEFNTEKAKGEITDKTLIIDKDGSLKAADEYDQISPDPNAYRVGNIPYFLKIPKIMEIIYSSENVCTVKTYNLWRNAL